MAVRFLASSPSDDPREGQAPYAGRLDSLLQLHLRLSEQREPQALFDLACQGACALLDASYAVLAVTRPIGAAQYCSYASDTAAAAPLASLPVPGSGWLGQVQAQRATRRINPVDGDPEQLGLPAGYPRIHAALAAPVASAEQSHGWICLAAQPDSPGFGQEDEHLLALIGAQLGRLLEHLERQREQRTRAERLRNEASEREQTGQTMLRMLQRLEALRALDSEILAARSPREVVRVGLEHLIHLVPYWGASVTMMDLAGNGVIVLAASGTAPDSRYDPGAYLTLEQYGLPDLVVLRQGLVRDVPDISALPQIPSVVDALYRQGMRSYARIPMMMEGTLIGALNLGSDRVGHFTGEQLDFARSLANQIGIAVQQATLRERIAQQSAELEERVKERTTQLASANEDLEAFSFTVSHDLRAPLRAIDGFSRMLQEDYAGKLDENGQHLLRTIRANSQRMGALIDDLLGFAQLGRARLNTARVDMGVLVREAWAETIGDAHIGFHLAPLPDVQGDRALLRQVWLNLLSNACKYSSKREQPAVEVSATEAEDEIIYAVRDNGAGFDMRYYEKLFGVFQRLHSNQEFPGTGVGLAMVHRVVTRHGGRVWAQSILDAGAQFYFSLPKLAPASPG